MRPPETLGIRHIALKVKDMAAARAFYTGVLRYTVEWEPDPENLYLTNGQDNLALHAAGAVSGDGALDHFGIILKTADDVDTWAAYLKENGLALEKEPKTHRDGARSFYVKDPEGNVLQFIHHPPIADALVPWYLKPGWIVILTLFALGPFALGLVWKTPKLGFKGKVVGTILVGLYSYWLLLTVQNMAAAAQKALDMQMTTGLGVSPEELQKALGQR